jgi:hypothetical protein
MVLHGKTIYPGKVLDRKVDAMLYLVQYDGLSASRSEWRPHREIISIDEVSVMATCAPCLCQPWPPSADVCTMPVPAMATLG